MIENFKTRARRHQSLFREDVLKVDYDTYVTWLKKSDAEKGLNFYNGFNIFKEVKERYPNYNQGLYAAFFEVNTFPSIFLFHLKLIRLFVRMY